MPTWKRMFIKAAGFGIGFAVLAALLLWGTIWYQSRPRPVKTWDPYSIKGTFAGIGTSDDENSLHLHYRLENVTNSDYLLDEKDGVRIVLATTDNSLLEPSSETLSFQHPVFIPAKHAAEVTITLRVGLHASLPSSNSQDDNAAYRKAVRQYLSEHLSRLHGFTILDDNEKYEIILPTPPADLGAQR